MATRGAAAREHLERLLCVATCLAQGGYGAQVAQLAACARVFYSDAQVWAAQAHHRGRRGRTHLMHAALMGSTARLQYLLDRGAAVEAASVRGWTALMFASDKGHQETARCLVERWGASVDAATVNNGTTALMSASFNGHLETVRCLVKRGCANVNAARTTNGATALMWASQKGHLEIVRFLVKCGGINVNAARATDGMTALMWASVNGNLEMVRCLVEREGVNVNAARTSNGWTALMAASAQGHLAVVSLLLQHGADRHALSHAGETAHALAASHPLVQAALA